MSITRFAAVVDALLTTLQADGALAGVDVIDGPAWGAYVSPEAVYIGHSGDDGNDSAGAISSEYHELGTAAKRDETVTVNCAVQVARGDDLLAQARLRAVTLFGAVESALRANISLGLSDVLRIEVTAGDVRQVRNADGCGVEVLFSVQATSLI